MNGKPALFYFTGAKFNILLHFTLIVHRNDTNFEWRPFLFSKLTDKQGIHKLRSR